MNTLPKRYRWVCPLCCVGVLAGKAPRKNATVRYCLSCSAKSTTLVERTCPALDRERKAAEDRRKAKAKRQREAAAKRKVARKRSAEGAAAKRIAAREAVAGDLHAELERMWPTAVLLCKRDDMPRRLPELVLRSRSDEHTSGRAWPWRHRIVVSVGLQGDAAGALGTLAHEVAHLLTPDDEPAHGRGFWSILVDLVVMCYGASVAIEDVDKATTSWSKHLVVEEAIRAVRQK